MYPFPQTESRPRSATLISTIVVVNIIWWMVMIAAIGVGTTHLGRCPVQSNIPIYLIVLGATCLLSASLTYTYSMLEGGMVAILCSTCMTLLHLFSLGWFIAGSVWVYRVYPPNYTPGARYCQRTTYQFAFYVTTLLWVAMILMFFCGCCFATLTCCTTVIASRRLIPNRSSFYGALSEEPTAGDV